MRDFALYSKIDHGRKKNKNKNKKQINKQKKIKTKQKTNKDKEKVSVLWILSISHTGSQGRNC